MPSRVQGHLASFPVLSLVRVSWFAALEYHYSAGLSPARRAPSMHKKPCFASQRNEALPCKAEPGGSLTCGGLVYPAATGRTAMGVTSPSSNGVSGCIRNAENPPSSSSPIDIRNGRYQLPVTSIT